tara:strand:- start:209 stop:613 length:405 start_codon:yes stop_codon:yes gene_type:complete
LNSKKPLDSLPKNFHEEERLLRLKGINSWKSLMNLQDKEINEIAQKGLATSRNLKRLRCIAILVTEIDLSPGDAALLMHSGVASIEALTALTPQELLTKTGRFERQLHTGRKAVVDLKKAHFWIQKAKNRQITN